MKAYTVRYTTKEGDSAKCTIHGYSKDDAELNLKREYWDVDTVDSVTLQ